MGEREGGRERGRGRGRPDSVAEQLCKALDWEVSGLILAMGKLSLTSVGDPPPQGGGGQVDPQSTDTSTRT